MRGYAERHQSQPTRAQTLRQWLPRALIIALAGITCLLVAACGSPTAPQLNLPGGTYTSTAYNFHVTYPRNWKANPFTSTPAASDAIVPIPFSLVITRTGGARTSASLVSTFSVTVMNLKNTNIAKSAAGLAKNNALQATTVGGKPGYMSQPLVQEVPNSQISVTHIDYFVILNGYEYQISTDAVKGDNADADIESMLSSFSFGG